MEGMRGFGRAATSARCRRDRTRVVVLESLGSPQLIVLEGEGMIMMHRLHAGALRGPGRRCARARRRPAAPRPAPRPRHRRPDPAQGRLPDRHARLGRPRTSSRPTTTRHRTRPPTSTRRAVERRRARAARRPSRRALSRAEQRAARAREPRSSRRGDLAGEAVLLQRGEQLAELAGPGRSPSSRGELVAAHQRRRRAVRAPRSASAEHLARQLEVGVDRRARRCGRAWRGGRRR